MNEKRLTHRHRILTDEQKALVEPVMGQVKQEHERGRHCSQWSFYQRVDQALADGGHAVGDQHIVIIPAHTVEAWDMVKEVAAIKPRSKPVGRRLAPEDTKTGIAQRHGEEMARVLNERQRFKRAIEILLGDREFTGEHIKMLIEEFRAGNFSSIGGTDYTKPVEDKA